MFRLLIATALLATVHATFFEPTNLRAVFYRVGTNAKCPTYITHWRVDGVGAQVRIVHGEISIVSKKCTTDGELRVKLYNGTSGLGSSGPGVPIFDALVKEGSPLYYAVDGTARTCGMYKVKKGTVFLFADTDKRVTLSNVDGVRELVPNSKYMIFAEPGGRSCVFKSRSSVTKKSNALCFPADAVVDTVGGARRMEEVRVGDEVLVGPRMYSKVFMFTHTDSYTMATFVRIQLSDGHVVRLTPGHYIYVNRELMLARDIRVGDVLQLANGDVSKVVSTRSIVGRGLYNPQTVHGNIVVDGVVASTFTEIIKPPVAQSMLAPLRCLYRILRLHTQVLHRSARL